MPAVYTVPIRKDLCLRLGDQRVFLQVKSISPRKVKIQLILPDDVRVERSPEPGDERHWPDGGINCVNEKQGYQLRRQRRA